LPEKGACLATKSTTSKGAARTAEIVRAGLVAMLLPVFFLYILLAKPDYKIMNAMSGIVVPVAHTIGDVVTWPVRVGIRIGASIRERTNALAENKKLRAELDAALAAQNECDTAIAENQRLQQLLDIRDSRPQHAILAGVIHENAAFRHDTLIIDKGETAGIRVGNAVVSPDGYLVGIVIDTNPVQSRVRTLSDMNSNITVRAAGTGVFGFLRGNAENAPVFEFFSDQAFRPTKGIRLITSGIKGNLPNDIPVGAAAADGIGSARVNLGAPAASVADVLVLSFDQKDGYK